ncbi:MAG: ABC transporter permease [Candidatus Didemnitutus sp.]|nr:ABC transporter permease [Candidatus Didemnitutus sp.]
MTTNLRLALRSLARSPGFTAVALLTLALGIGANVAIYSAINTLFLRPLNFAEPSRLVRVWGAFADRGLDQANLSYPRYEHFRDNLDAVESLSALAGTAFTLTGGGDPVQLTAARVTQNFFPVLGVQPQRGRNFLAKEDRTGGAPVVLISAGLWQRQFNRAPDAVGQALILNNVPHTIIGILPDGFGFPFNGIDVFAARPFELEGLPRELMLQGSGYLLVHGRLKPGATLETLDAQLKRAAATYAAAHPEKVDANGGIFARSMQADLVGGQRPVFFVLLAAVGFVLLIACANVANLFLVRLAARRKEIAIRAALGATRRSIVAQFLTESTLVALAAGLAGSLLAVWGVDSLARIAADFIPRAQEISVDLPVLGFALLLSLATGLGMGFLPAWQASHADVNETLKDATRGNTGGRAANRLRSALFVGEVALSLVLLIGAALLLRSFVWLQGVSPGFDATGVSTFNVQLSPAQYPDADAQTAFYAQLVQRLSAIPGVTAVSGINNLPVVAGGNTRSPFSLEGEALPPINERRLAVRSNTLPGYFATMGIPIKQGRDFDWRDRTDRSNVLLISESTAKRLFPHGENPIGRRLITGLGSIPREIVGVVGEVRATGLDQVAGDALYYPTAQLGDGFFSLVLRSSRPAASLRDEIRAAVHALDRGIPVDQVLSFHQLTADSISDRRLVIGLVGGFAALALVLAALGIYGVIAYSVAQRTAEIGVRMALGASRVAIVGLVVREGLRLTLVGLAIGVAIALGLTRLLGAQLYEVSATDPAAFVGVSIFLVFVAAFACWLPAHRASRIDPLVALRSE